MNSRIRRPLYIFPLNPDYVAARSLRSLRSNNNKVFLFVDAASPLEPRVQYIRRGFEQWHFIADCRGIIRTNWS